MVGRIAADSSSFIRIESTARGQTTIHPLMPLFERALTRIFPEERAKTSLLEMAVKRERFS